MKNVFLPLCLVFVSSFYLTASDCFLQDDRKVSGLITDAQGQILDNAALTVIEHATRTSCSLSSDASGRFKVRLNPALAYTLTFEANGEVVEFYLAPESEMNPGDDHDMTDGGVSITFGDPPDDGQTNGEGPGIANHDFEIYAQTSDSNPTDGGDKEGDLDGGVSVVFGDAPSEDETNGEPLDPADRPKTGWKPAPPDGTQINSIGNRLSGGLNLPRPSMFGNDIRKFRMRVSFASTEAAYLYLDNLRLNHAVRNNGNVTISVYPGGFGTFDIEIEAVSDQALHLNEQLMTLDLVHQDPDATFSVNSSVVTGLIRVERHSGSVKYFRSKDLDTPVRPLGR
ncbi:carboxypeptidase-like regulatory domain-containing protein [Acanthopleuribacter pedis]|uniref:Carboxypeptidase regulatory-like domain-containing protein n=1 Tax=Acanthopleuribacter pedis TaxID=442870 RepID=A0A8J7Q7F0_9BACT|nr:carboxypeptidase-like regulatory domain-containing protein [Acanthopleuribacter pedis]MBO1319711.1 carboxypeptidase regulatory-like domain-containing protein [Acanthopleuribacter pedis]